MTAKIKKGDRVVVISGADKGKNGDVVEVDPVRQRVLIRGINMATQHQKKTSTQDGGIVKREKHVHLSNVTLMDPQDGKPAHVGFRFKDREIMVDGEPRIEQEKVRFSKHSGKEIE